MIKPLAVCFTVLALFPLAPRISEATTRPATTQAAARSLDALLEPIRAKRKLPGLVAAVVAGDDVIAIGAAGVRKLGSDVPMTAHDKIHLGSCTKAMTATVIARLVERKLITWDATVPSLFPELQAKVHDGYRAATLEQLLHHRAGLPANTSWGLFGVDQRRDVVAQRLEAMTFALGQPPASPPGTAYAYSNVGYSIAGSIIEKATGRTWEEVIKQELFDPLGMTSAGFGPPGTPGEVDQPWGHLALGKLAMPTQGDNLPIVGPAGRAHCSIRDWAKFVSLHLRGARGEERAYLSPDTFARMHRTRREQADGYAHGWSVLQRAWAGGTVLNHAGSNNLWFCVVWIAPEKNFAVLAATNIGGEEAAAGCDDACAAMIAQHLKTPAAATLPTTRAGG